MRNGGVDEIETEFEIEGIRLRRWRRGTVGVNWSRASSC